MPAGEPTRRERQFARRGGPGLARAQAQTGNGEAEQRLPWKPTVVGPLVGGLAVGGRGYDAWPAPGGFGLSPSPDESGAPKVASSNSATRRT